MSNNQKNDQQDQSLPSTVRYKGWYLWYVINLSHHPQTEIAEKLGVTKQVVSLWAKGRQKPSLEKLHNLCFDTGYFSPAIAKHKFDEAIKAYINDIKLAKFKLTGEI
jgi:transcriptional regulator with XRE-family HTH domain